MLSLVVALAVVTASSAASAEGPLAVTTLPLAAGEGVSAQGARGVDALFRERLEASDFLKVLPRQKPDTREASRCGVDPGCLSSLAYARGADLLAAGVVEGRDDGFLVRLVVVEPRGAGVLREVSESVIGTRDDMAFWLDRLVRRAFLPEALAGGLFIVGEPAGARVFIDGAFAGELPFAEPLTGVIEGEHRVTVEHPGYAPFTRRVEVRFREVTRVNVVLRALLAEGDEPGAVPTGVLGGPLIPLSVAGASAAVFGGGLLFGTLALIDQAEVEHRAKQQMLLLPRHEGLLARGEAFAFTANVLYAAAALGLGAAGALLLTDFLTTPTPGEERTFTAPARGAPERDELRLGIDE